MDLYWKLVKGRERKLMKILVCSSSGHKRGAVLDAAERLGFPSPEIQTRETSSGVPNQPLGDDQTLLGALQRATVGQTRF